MIKSAASAASPQGLPSRDPVGCSRSLPRRDLEAVIKSAASVASLAFAGERQDDGSVNGRQGTGRSPANPKLLDGLGKPICGVRKAIVPLLSLCMPLLFPYYVFFMQT